MVGGLEEPFGPVLAPLRLPLPLLLLLILSVVMEPMGRKEGL